MFLNAIEHLLRRKLLTVSLIVFAVFILLFWWGVASSAGTTESNVHINSPSGGRQPVVSPEDKAWIAMATAGPMLATILVGLTIVMGASVLPDEIASGRLSLWASLPQSRLKLYVSTSLAPLALSTVLGWLFFFSSTFLIRAYFPFAPASFSTALIAMPIWIAVTWAAVTTLSLIMGKIPAMLVTFILGGFSATMGSIVELGKTIPEVGESGIYRVAGIVTLVFPIERGYRAILAGLLPTRSTIDEFLALMGYSGNISTGELLYPLVWSALLFFLGYVAFRKKEIQ